MKVGLIVEGTRDGPDVLVIPRLIKLICDKYQVPISLAWPVPMTTLQRLKSDCGRVANRLLKVDNCERVIIIWDVDPKPSNDAIRDLSNDVQAMRASLKASSVDRSAVDLIGIKRELESWLIADVRSVSATIAQLTRDRRIPTIDPVPNPEEQEEPKAWLSDLFRQNAIGSGYRDSRHGVTLAEKLPDLDAISQCSSFRRLIEKLSARSPQEPA